jgi:hypothetical protein
MPEGPGIVILKEAVQLFKGKKVLSVSGNSSIDKDRLVTPALGCYSYLNASIGSNLDAFCAG